MEVCIGSGKWPTEWDQSPNSISKPKTETYTMSLSQQCEHIWYQRLLSRCLTVIAHSDRIRLLSDSSPTQTLVAALTLAWKNWNLSSQEWLFAAKSRFMLDVRSMITGCANCNFGEIALQVDRAFRCVGRIGQ